MNRNLCQKHPTIVTAEGLIAPEQTLAGITPEQLTDWYRAMVQVRTFDEKCVALQRTGQLGTYPSCLGMEAIGTGIGHALAPEDTYIPFYRDQAAQLSRGVSMSEVLAFWSGDERGSQFKHSHDFANTICIATQCSQAAGVASSFKYRQEPRVAVCSLGDGATSKGDFSEALNFAGAWQLPLVIVIHNNQWAISVPRHKQSAAQDLADKGLGAGVASHQVDGNDVASVYRVVKQAIERARAGKGPALIEAVSYRLSDHTTADDASRYRSQEEVKGAWAKEPIARLKRYLTLNGHWSDELETDWKNHCQHRVDEAISEFKQWPAQPASAMFDYLYARLPEALKEQRQLLQQRHPGL